MASKYHKGKKHNGKLLSAQQQVKKQKNNQRKKMIIKQIIKQDEKPIYVKHISITVFHLPTNLEIEICKK